MTDLALWQKLKNACAKSCEDLIDNHDVARGAVESFNQFLTEGVPQTIKQLPIVSSVRDGVRYTLQLTNPKLSSPRMVEGGSETPFLLLPSTCRERNLTYAATLHVDVVVRVYQWPQGEILARRRPVDGTVRYSDPTLYRDPRASERLRHLATATPHSHSAPDVLNAQDPGRMVSMKTEKNVFLCKIPIATRSALCHLDHGHQDAKTWSELGGTFIIEGMNKIMPPLARLAHNEVFVFRDQKHAARLEIRCAPYSRRFSATATLSMVLTRPPTHGFVMNHDVMVTLPFVVKPIPVAVLIRALGWSLVSFTCLIGSMMGENPIPELDFKLRTLFAGLPSNCTQEVALVMLANCSSANARHVGATMRSSAGEVREAQEGKGAQGAQGVKEKEEEAAEVKGATPGDATLSLVRFGQHTLSHSLFPHLNEAVDKKVYLLARCVWKLLACTSVPPVASFDDRDLHKRYESCGTLWTSLFRQVLTNYLDLVSRQLTKHLAGGSSNAYKEVSIHKIIDGEFPTAQFTYCMKTGMWCATKSAVSARRNISQSLTCSSESALVAHYSRLSSSVNSEARDTAPRQVRGAAFLRQCPSHTPEDRFCGLTTHIAFGARMSMGSDPHLLMRIVARKGACLITPFENWPEEFANVFDGSGAPQDLNAIAEKFASSFLEKVPIFIESEIVGWTNAPEAFSLLIRSLRRGCAVAPDVGVTLHSQPERCVRVRCCAGRILAPLLRIDAATHAFWRTNQRFSVADLEAAGILEYLDADEMVNCVTATSCENALERIAGSGGQDGGQDGKQEKGWEFTHLLMDPALIFSSAAARIPFAHHDASTRVSYSASMIGQGVDLRMDRNAMQANKHTLLYPQRQLVKSRFTRAGGGALDMCGQLLKVAVYDMGANQNDAFIVNRQAVQRGMFHSGFERLYKSEMPVGVQSQREQFQRPDPNTTAQVKFGRLDHLDPRTGLPSVGSIVRAGDVVIGRVEQLKGTATAQIRALDPTSSALDLLDSSTVHHGETAVVARTLMTRGQHGNLIAKTVVRCMTGVKDGDKISSLHGQKGVLLEEDEWNMPFSISDGTAPDVLIGAPGISSRNTNGQLHESQANKAFCLNPQQMTLQGLHDATAFAQGNPAKIQEVLRNGGFSPNGTERYCLGTTGQLVDAHVYVGLVYMQRLRHLVSQKQHACATAPRNPVTQQPCSGRHQGGALRTGTMELDALAGHGCEEIMSECMRTESDPAWMWCCTVCGAITNVVVGNTFCSLCGGKNTGKPMPTVGFFKVLVNELACINICCTLPLKKLFQLDKFHKRREFAHSLAESESKANDVFPTISLPRACLNG